MTSDHSRDQTDASADRLVRRMDLFEERLTERLRAMKNDLYQALLIGFGVIAALVLVANALTG